MGGVAKGVLPSHSGPVTFTSHSTLTISEVGRPSNSYAGTPESDIEVVLNTPPLALYSVLLTACPLVCWPATS